MKCQQIYRASRERIPVFPIEWVLVENIRNMKNLKLGLEELTNIKNCYQEYYEREIESRKVMEGKIIQHFNKKGQNGEELITEKISCMNNRDDVDEDQYQCKYCTDLCFLSMLTCTNCSNQAEEADKDDLSENEKQEAENEAH